MQHAPVLELRAASSAFDASTLPSAALELRLLAGECALIEAHDPATIADFADLCSGLIVLRAGSVRCMDHDWSELDRERAAALRGRIGRTHQRGGWPAMLPTHVSIMLPQLHHTRTPPAQITRSAVAISRLLGLPGLPLTRPGQLAEGDLVRAGCARAFLGAPDLLLFESSLGADRPDLTVPFLDLLSQALDRGAAAICFTREASFWRAQRFPLSHRLVLHEDGLAQMRGD
ncbi:ABC transporter ATP-binding protein [Lichenicoccus sp.]|uniref:ABC transporter ATP-binding protein n=1 Tax=Lichenicoccus sp. TaxID=2781899 RepID=UPI003D0B7726